MPILGLQNSASGSAPYSKFDRWSLAFDGSDEILNVGDLDSTFADAHSFSFWIKLADAQADNSGRQYLAGLSNNTGHDMIYISIESNGKLKWYLKANNEAESGICSTALSDGASAWTHFAVTASMGETAGNVVAFYLNGSVVNSTSLSSLSKTNWNAFSSGVDFVIAGYNNNGSVAGHTNCNISDFAVYNSALSASNVTSIYNSGNGYNHRTGVASANLAAWWRMGDGAENATGTTIYDESANSNNGTMTNMEAADFQEDTP